MEKCSKMSQKGTRKTNGNWRICFVLGQQKMTRITTRLLPRRGGGGARGGELGPRGGAKSSDAIKLRPSAGRVV